MEKLNKPKQFYRLDKFEVEFYFYIGFSKDSKFDYYFDDYDFDEDLGYCSVNQSENYIFEKRDGNWHFEFDSRSFDIEFI